MVNKILTASGVPYRRGRFTAKKENPTYAVYTDDISTELSPDGIPIAVLTHAITVELYEDAPDDAAEAAVEAAIMAAGLQWEKTDRVWLQSEQQYAVFYMFSYIEKRRI